MNRVFQIRQIFSIPDETKVCPFLNPFYVSEQERLLEKLSQMGIAANEIDAGAVSKFHFVPVIALDE